MEINPANQLRLVVYPIIYKVVYIPNGAGCLPSIASAYYSRILQIFPGKISLFEASPLLNTPEVSHGSPEKLAHLTRR